MRIINGSISAIFLLAIVNNYVEIMAYPIVNAILIQIDADLSASEAHGMATGMLCVNAGTTVEYWLSELLHDGNVLTDADKPILVRLFDETRRLLASNEFEFDLFLPDDDMPLSSRVIALTRWCQGFLYGIGAAVRAASGVSEEAREILKDISEFTKLDTDAEGEEDENAFIEITEYLRPAVLLLRDELGNPAEGSVPGDRLETNRI